ncbi:MAG TPA: hypothetical protein VHO24_03505 [Opitutaceae bacterium]|nr:hypothetical protein [Opitutaceae bacterium]
MIIPSSSTNRAPLPPSLSPAGQPAPAPRAPRSDQLSTESGSHLKAALERQPAVRPEMLARARELAADSAHPPAVMMKQLAQYLLSTPDLSSDES